MARFVIFPGTAGSYADTGDINELDADTAHLQQSIGDWITSAGSSSVVLSQDITPLFGSNVMKATMDGAGTGLMRTALNVPSMTVLPDTEYTFSAWVYPLVANRAEIVIRTYTAGTGGTLTQGGLVDVPANTWTQIFLTHTTEPTKDGASIEIHVETNVLNDVLYADELFAGLGSVATFVPSLRIVGDLEMETKLSVTDWSSSTQYFQSTNRSNQGFYLRVDASGDIRCGWDIATSVTTNYTLINGEVSVIKITWDPSISSNNVLFYQDNLLVDTLSVASFTPSGTQDPVQPLVVGQSDAFGSFPLDGDLYTTSIRDGIDGPIVAIFDAEDIGL